MHQKIDSEVFIPVVCVAILSPISVIVDLPNQETKARAAMSMKAGVDFK